MATPSIEQQARITQIKGNVQLIRDGFFLPAQVGQLLLPGDRLLSADNARAMIQFTGVKDKLVIEQGAAATFNLEVVAVDQVPQWIASDLQGEGIFFENPQRVESASTMADNQPMMGLLGGTGPSTGTGYPVLEVTAGLLATAAVFSDYSSDDNSASATTGTPTGGTPGTGSSESAGGASTPGGTPATGQPGGQAPQPSPEPMPEATASPLDALVAPVLDILEASPLAVLVTPLTAPLSSQALDTITGGLESMLPASPLPGG